MSLGEDEAVSFVPMRILGVESQLVKEQNGHDVRYGHAGAGMSVPSVMHGLNHVKTQPVSHAG